MTQGSCLCGTVRFELTGKTTEIGMCHCSKCRKVSGVASNATLMAAKDDLRWISGEDALLKYAMPDGWGVWRCATCGSPVPRLHPGGGAYWVPAGLLDGSPDLDGNGRRSLESEDVLSGSLPGDRRQRPAPLGVDVPRPRRVLPVGPRAIPGFLPVGATGHGVAVVAPAMKRSARSSPPSRPVTSQPSPRFSTNSSAEPCT